MSALQATRRLPYIARQYSTATAKAPASEWAAKRVAAKDHAAHTAGMWRKIAFYFCIPACLVTGVYVNKLEAEHKAHRLHEKHERGDTPQPEYKYLNKRDKPYPWGMNSLFFNPEANKDMSQTA